MSRYLVRGRGRAVGGGGLRAMLRRLRASGQVREDVRHGSREEVPEHPSALLDALWRHGGVNANEDVRRSGVGQFAQCHADLVAHVAGVEAIAAPRMPIRGKPACPKIRR